MCKRLCTNGDHLHGLEPGAVHLCGLAFTLMSLAYFSYGVLPIGKNIHALLSALRKVFARLRLRHIQSKQRLPDVMKRFNTQRYADS